MYTVLFHIVSFDVVAILIANLYTIYEYKLLARDS